MKVGCEQPTLRLMTEARAAFEAAAKLTRNMREAAYLLARAGACD
jgi:predicted RNA polymerase sigma factor